MNDTTLSDIFKKFFTALFFFFLSHGFLVAQEGSNVPAVKLVEAGVVPGYFVSDFPFISIEDFKALAPDSRLLQNDYSDFTSGEPFFNSRGGAMFNAAVGMQFRSGKTGELRPNPLLRVAVSSYSGNFFKRDFNRSQSFPVDTLTSSQTGEIIVVDSSSFQTLSMHYKSRQVALDISVIFRTNPDARWSLYGGVGLSLGYSYNATTRVDYNSDGSRYDYNNRYNGLSQSESFDNDNGLRSMVYLPIGFDFRLGKKREFWQRIHLFTEVRPGLFYYEIPALDTYLQGFFSQGFGAKVVW